MESCKGISPCSHLQQLNKYVLHMQLFSDKLRTSKKLSQRCAKCRNTLQLFFENISKQCRCLSTLPFFELGRHFLSFTLLIL